MLGDAFLPDSLRRSLGLIDDDRRLARDLYASELLVHSRAECVFLTGRKSLAGSLGAFGRRADHRYGGLKPFESRWDDGDYLAKLRMSQEVAAWIKAAAAS